jgi:hypothetical protein
MDTPFIKIFGKKKLVTRSFAEVRKFILIIFFLHFVPVPTRSIEEKNLIQFFDARSASCSYQVILFLAIYSSINLI